MASVIDPVAFGARLTEAIELRKTNDLQLSQRTGIDNGYIGRLKRGERKGNPAWDLVERLSAALNVNSRWLAVGEGPRDIGGTQVAADERYHAMPLVRESAKSMNYPAAFIATFESQLDFDYQPTFDDLWTICKAEYAKWKGKRITGGNPLADLDPPKRTRRSG